jgi:hypothetical protein
MKAIRIGLNETVRMLNNIMEMKDENKKNEQI